MTEETALTVQDADFTNGDLVQYNSLLDQRQIVQMGDNLMGVHPAAKDVGKLGMRTVAQLALMTGANPLPGTNGIHVWVDNKGKICIQFGIGFWRGKAEEQGGIIWEERPRPMTDEEKEKWGVSNNEVGWICKGTTWDAVRTLRRQEKELGGELSLSEAREILYKEGVSTVSLDTWGAGDTAKYKEQKSGRPVMFTASERCERDLLRKLVPIFTPNKESFQRVADKIAGPSWDGLEEHDSGYTVEAANGELIAPTNGEYTDGEYEEIEPEPEPEPQEVETETEPAEEPAQDDDLKSLIADCRAELEGKIVDGRVELGLVMDAAAMTPLYETWKQTHNALAADDGFEFPDGFKVNRKQTITGEGALKVYDWLVERKAGEMFAFSEEV